MFSTRNFNRSKPVLFILILFPSLLWAYQFVTGNLGVNPIEKLMDELGLMALRLIIITLMITTLSNIRPFKIDSCITKNDWTFFFLLCLFAFLYLYSFRSFFRYAIYHSRYYKKTIYNFWFYKLSFFNPTC
jgi:DMSO/TMAO reductase YedYZ heme-binding membrane subunit